MMAMAFNYLPMAPQLKENFWGNFPYTTQLVRDCDTKYMYQTRGDLSSAQNLYARGLNQVNGACTDLNAGVGVKESFDSTYNSTVTPLLSQTARDMTYPSTQSKQFAGRFVEEEEKEMFQKDTREDFTCLISNNDGRTTLSEDYTPAPPLHQFNYGDINPVSGQVPFNSCSGPVICRDRIMYSPARSRYTAGANPILGDLVIAGEPTVTWTSGAAIPNYGLSYIALSGGPNNLNATINTATTGHRFGHNVTGAAFLDRSQVASGMSIGRS